MARECRHTFGVPDSHLVRAIQLSSLAAEETSAFHEHGFIRIPRVFSESEIARYREGCSKGSGGDVLSNDALEHVILDERVITPVRDILGQVVYFGESSYRFDDKPSERAARHYHNDARVDGGDYDKPYPIVRVGLYLQDHVTHSGGLKLRPGSHRLDCLEELGRREALARLLRGRVRWKQLSPGLNVPTLAGDLLIWSMRIHHSGYAVRLRGAPNLCLPPWLENLVPSFLARPLAHQRCVIFASFGSPSPELEAYIEQRVRHPGNVDHWRKCRFDRQSIRDLCERRGITLDVRGLRAVRDQL